MVSPIKAHHCSIRQTVQHICLLLLLQCAGCGQRKEDAGAARGPPAYANIFIAMMAMPDAKFISDTYFNTFEALGSEGLRAYFEDLLILASNSSQPATWFWPVKNAWAYSAAQFCMTPKDIQDTLASVPTVASTYARESVMPNKALLSDAFRDGMLIRTLDPEFSLTLRQVQHNSSTRQGRYNGSTQWVLQGASVNGSDIPLVRPNITAGAAVIHIIDGVIMSDEQLRFWIQVCENRGGCDCPAFRRAGRTVHGSTAAPAQLAEAPSKALWTGAVASLVLGTIAGLVILGGLTSLVIWHIQRRQPQKQQRLSVQASLEGYRGRASTVVQVPSKNNNSNSGSSSGGSSSGGSSRSSSGGSVLRCSPKPPAHMPRQQTGDGYPHALPAHLWKVLYLLTPGYGTEATEILRFTARSDDVSRNTGRREQLYVLLPGHTAGPPAGEHPDTLLAQAMMGLQLGSSSAGTAMYMSQQQRSVVKQVVAAAGKAAQHRPAFDELKLRWNFGKNFFYNGVSSSTGWSIQQMQAKEIPHDFKSVFSNAVQPCHLASLQSWLKQQSFQQVDSKERASVHVIHQATNADYTLSFIKASNGSLQLRKTKSGNSKLAFLTLLAEPDQPDWRAKLLAQYHLKQDSLIQPLLSALSVSAHTSGPNKLSFSNLATNDLLVDRERHKTKTVYQGSFSNKRSGYSSSGSNLATLIKVTVSKVVAADTAQVSHEVAGTSPQLNELLTAVLQSGGMSAAQEQEMGEHLENMLAFARSAVAVLEE